MIDTYGTGKYIIRFQAYSPVPGWCQVYMQNGSDSKYKMYQEFDLTSSWKTYQFVIDVANGENVPTSYLAFYGIYGTGRYVYVRNIAMTKCP